MDYYKLNSVAYCFPYDVECYILNPFDRKTNEKNKSLLGVLEKYYEKEMTRIEADELLSNIILEHPYIPNSMFVEIGIGRYSTRDGRGVVSNYQHLCMKSYDYPKRQDKYDPTPIRWEK